jgi:hypothetical protein
MDNHRGIVPTVFQGIAIKNICYKTLKRDIFVELCYNKFKLNRGVTHVNK